MSRSHDETDAELAALDYYTLLGVAQDATREQIRAAFRRFALRYHPDRFVDQPPALAARALSIYRRGGEAIDVLADPVQRKAYDAVLARGEKRLKDDPAVLLRRVAAAAAPSPPRAPAAPAATPPAPPADEKVATFGKPSERNPRASRPKRATKKSLRALRPPVTKPAAAPRPSGPTIKSPQAKAFHDRAQAAIAAGDLRGAWRMLKAAVEAEPDNHELERALYAVERQFRA